jgi:hypothetical protein
MIVTPECPPTTVIFSLLGLVPLISETKREARTTSRVVTPNILLMIVLKLIILKKIIMSKQNDDVL